MDENLKKLFDAQTADDIQKGDDLLKRFAAPKPDQAVVAEIKNDIARQLKHRRRNRIVRRSSEMAVAAVLVVGTLLGLFVMNQERGGSNIISATASEWNLIEDAEYSVILAEVENIEGSITTIRMDDHDDYEYDNLVDIEMEMLEIESAFWKG